jgi:hypothetical protein
LDNTADYGGAASQNASHMSRPDNPSGLAATSQSIRLQQIETKICKRTMIPVESRHTFGGVLSHGSMYSLPGVFFKSFLDFKSEVVAMAALFSILGGLFGIGSLVCFIMVVIKMFQDPDTKTMGIVSLVTICCGIGGLIAFIVGWMNADKLGVKNIMLIWTGCFVGALVCNLLSAAMGGIQLDMPR